MTPEDIETAVTQEVARLRAQDLIDPRTPLSTFFAHPFVLTIAGFLFTFAISTWIEHTLSERRNARDQQAAQIAEIDQQAATRRASLIAIDQLARERIIAGDMLRSALGRGASEEVAPRKTAYDDVFIRWNERLHINLLTLSQFETQGTHADYTTAIETHVQRVFPQIDGCLTAQYDTLHGRTRPAWRCPNKKLSGEIATWKGALKDRSVSITRCLDAILATGLADIDHRARAEKSALRGMTPPPRSTNNAVATACPDMRAPT